MDSNTTERNEAQVSLRLKPSVNLLPSHVTTWLSVVMETIGIPLLFA
jgi:hypothetical protein